MATKVFNDVVITIPQVTISGKYIESVFDDFVDLLPEIGLDNKHSDTVEFNEALTLVDKEAFADKVKTLVEAEIKTQFNKRNIENALSNINVYTDGIAHDIISQMKNISNTPAFKEIVKQKKEKFAAYKKKHAAEELKSLRVQAAALGYKLVEEE